MVHRITQIALWLAFLGCFTFQSATSNGVVLAEGYLDRVPLGAAVSDSATIARVRITDREPVYIDDNPKLGICGYQFRAVVVERLKGAFGTIQFFAIPSVEFAGFDHDYLVFVYHRDEMQVRAAIRTLVPSLALPELNDLSCRNSAPFFIPARGHMMLVFSEFAANRFGEAWLPAPTSSGHLYWCVQERPDSPTEDVGVRELAKGDELRQES